MLVPEGGAIALNHVIWDVYSFGTVWLGICHFVIKGGQPKGDRL